MYNPRLCHRHADLKALSFDHIVSDFDLFVGSRLGEFARENGADGVEEVLEVAGTGGEEPVAVGGGVEEDARFEDRIGRDYEVPAQNGHGRVGR